jgi:hypothetical protein
VAAAIVAPVRALLLAIACALVAREAAAGADRHAVYGELLGKGGLYGLGYEMTLAPPRLAVGAALSFFGQDGQSVTSVSPYLAWYPVRGERHGWFVHGGPQVVRVTTRSPVMEWDGERSTGLGLELSSGYEYRRGALFRIHGMAAAGKGGIAPWLGASFGWSF